jgi:hypothetical protein
VDFAFRHELTIEQAVEIMLMQEAGESLEDIVGLTGGDDY